MNGGGREGRGGMRSGEGRRVEEGADVYGGGERLVLGRQVGGGGVAVGRYEDGDGAVGESEEGVSVRALGR